MAFPIGPSTQVFVGSAMLLLAGTLVAAGRRRNEGLLLSAFLALVGTNLVCGALSVLTREPGWERVAFLALAADPLFLLLFASRYPYRRRHWGLSAALGLLLITSATLAMMVVFRPELIIPAFSGSGRAPSFLAIVGQLVLAYGLAWIVAVDSLKHAPTKLLHRRGVWFVVALGVTVLPRLGLVTEELSLRPGLLLFGPLWLGWELPFGIALDVLVQVSVVGAFAFASLYRSPGRPPVARQTRRYVLWTAAAAAALLALGLVIRFVDALSPWLEGTSQVAWSMRWMVFGALLVYGILSYELLDFPQLAPRGVGLLGGLLGAFAGFIAATATAQAAGATGGLVVLLGLAVGAGFSVPGATGARSLMRRLAPGARASATSDRRLELYRAALESAWVHGPPSSESRRALERDRRAFGVSHDEARVLEHVVAANLSNPQSRLKVGDEPLPGLLLEERLGEGSQGVVFAASRLPGGGRLIVKEFPLDRGGASVARRQLLRELRPVRGLDHPRIVRLLDVQAVPGRYLLLYEYIEGKSLSATMADRRMATADAKAIGRDVLEALQAAHAAGIVHRDIKPANILVDAAGHARLTDFGIASMEPSPQEVRATITNLDSLGAAAGTMAYMAPEQLRRSEVGPATDLYQLGLVLYEMLADRPALDVRGHDLMEFLNQIARPQISMEPVPAGWRAFLGRALEPDPGRRFSSASEMKQALDAL